MEMDFLPLQGSRIQSINVIASASEAIQKPQRMRDGLLRRKCSSQ